MSDFLRASQTKRLIHRESQQLFIGPYAIGADRMLGITTAGRMIIDSEIKELRAENLPVYVPIPSKILYYRTLYAWA